MTLDRFITPASDYAVRVDNLFYLLSIVCGLIVLLVTGLIVVFFALYYRGSGMPRGAVPERKSREIEIGWTFLSRAHWGGATNREMKHLMLTHAFASLETVIFCVGERNGRSRRAVEKLGGRLLDRAAHAARPDHVTYAIRRADFRG